MTIGSLLSAANAANGMHAITPAVSAVVNLFIVFSRLRCGQFSPLLFSETPVWMVCSGAKVNHDRAESLGRSLARFSYQSSFFLVAAQVILFIGL
jgi:hypothetical protein